MNFLDDFRSHVYATSSNFNSRLARATRSTSPEVKASVMFELNVDLKIEHRIAVSSKL